MDHQAILRDELEKRCAHNPRYSLRAYARDLCLSPSHLSGVLKGQYGLSREGATNIAKKIGLSRTESEFFIQSVESLYGRSQLARTVAAEKLSQLQNKKRPQQLKLDHFRLIADWFHFAILELTYLKKFKGNFKWMANALGLNEIQVSAAVHRLQRLGLLSISKNDWRPTDDMTETDFNSPSEAVKTFHTQLLDKAKQAIRFQSLEDRDFRSTVLAIRKDRLPEAKAALAKLHQEFCEQVSGDSIEKDQVYCLSTQLFSLTDFKEHSQ